MRTASVVCLALTSSCLLAQVEPPVGKRGLEATLADSDIPRFTDFRPRINAMRVPPDGSGRRFLVRMSGELHVVRTDGTVGTYTNLKTVFGPDFVDTFDIARGFTSLAFHPEFATNGIFYTVHTEDDSASGADHAPAYLPPSGIAGDPLTGREQDCVLVEWTATDPGADTFTGTRRELMRLRTVGWWHPMGEIRFNPLATPADDDYGLLYIAVGDGESYTQGNGGTDPARTNNLQRLDSYLGTILRIDPLGNDGPNGRYGIPAANPFTDTPGALGEIFAYGCRNPHRFGWDPVTGACFIYDIGEFDIEEINVLAPGANYGWPQREGTFLVGALPLDPQILDGTLDDGFTYPVAQWDHDDGRAIAGGAVCRGCGAASFEGMVLTGNIPSGSLYAARIADLLAADDGIPQTVAPLEELQVVYNGQRLTHLEVIQRTVNEGRVGLRFGVDGSGTIYAMNKRDGILRTIADGPVRTDVTTTNTNPGDPGYGSPDGTTDGADLFWFVEAWLAGLPASDATSSNTNPGELGSGVPDGTVDGADLSWFVEAWLGI